MGLWENELSVRSAVGRCFKWSKLSSGLHALVDSTVLCVRIHHKGTPGKANKMEHRRGIITPQVQQRKSGNN